MFSFVLLSYCQHFLALYHSFNWKQNYDTIIMTPGIIFIRVNTFQDITEYA